MGAPHNYDADSAVVNMDNLPQKRLAQLSTKTGLKPRGPLLEAGLLLVYLRCYHPLYSLLSLNIVREIAAYCLFPALLAGVSNSVLQVYNLSTESRVSSKCVQVKSVGAGMTLLDPWTLLVVGGTESLGQALTLNIEKGTVRQEAGLRKGRAWMGVIGYNGFGWVFGGDGAAGRLAFAEKFHRAARNWQQLPAMRYPRAFFTPCLHAKRFYLPASGTLLEAYDIALNAYAVFPLRMADAPNGCVAFDAGDALVVVASDKSAGTWVFDSTQTTLTPLSMTVNRVGGCLTNCTPVSRGFAVYWLSRDLALLKTDVRSMSLQKCGDT